MMALSIVELKQISKISGYPFEICYLHTDLKSFRIVANYVFQAALTYILFVKATDMVTNSV